jgi:hypothetical protein
MLLLIRMAPWIPALAAIALFAMLTGCGKTGSEYTVAPVKGKVTYNGEAVKGGSITLRPIAAVDGKEGVTGKPASGSVGGDGTFVLSTYGKNDGAVVGKHQVMYFPGVAGASSYEDKPARSPYAGLVPKTEEVEVIAGQQNEINIELGKRGPAGR